MYQEKTLRRLFLQGSCLKMGFGGMGKVDSTRLTVETLFLDPSYLGTGSPAVLAEVTSLEERLKEKGLALVLVMTGVKCVQAQKIGSQSELPRLSFSQVGVLNGQSHRFSRPVFLVD